MHDGGFGSHGAVSQIVGDLVQRQFGPQPVFGHDLIKLLQFAEAGNVGLAGRFFRATNGEATGAGEGRVFAELLMDELRFEGLSGEHQSEKTFQQGEETFGRSSGEAGRGNVGVEALCPNGNFRRRGTWRLVEHCGILVERGPEKDQPLCGFGLRFRVGGRQVFSMVVSLLGLLLVELSEAFVVIGVRLLKATVIQVRQHVEPTDVGLILQIEVIGFDEFDQWQLAGGRNKCDHRRVLHAGE